MFKKRIGKLQPEFSSKDKLFFYPPTDENILDIVSKDKNAFNLDFFMELSKSSPNPILGEAMKKYTELLSKGYIKLYLFKENKLTFKGKMYRIYLKKGIPFWAIIITTIIGVASILSGIIIYVLSTKKG